ncbi:MAG TPA: copper resistance CopC family protein [Candidatus Acidoferrum sp.]|nr:copper resistance CopC family protein [Candidatus Acidoferrum sp.]
MRTRKFSRVRMAGLLAPVVALLLGGSLLEGHAVLKDSSPMANGAVEGPDVPIRLHYNVRVDAALSKLELLNPDQSTTSLAIGKQPAADTLTSEAKGLKPGSYKIRWQVLAPDGHITRGEVPFTVTGS